MGVPLNQLEGNHFGVSPLMDHPFFSQKHCGKLVYNPLEFSIRWAAWHADRNVAVEVATSQNDQTHKMDGPMNGQCNAKKLAFVDPKMNGFDTKHKPFSAFACTQ